MPKKIDPAVRQRVLRMAADHVREYPTPTALAKVIAARERVGVETVRRWIVQAQVDAGERPGVTSEESTEIKALKARVRRLEEDNAILKAATGFLRRGTRPPQPLIMGFIDTMRSEGHAVESVCQVLREQGCQVAARTYRAWRGRPPAARTVSDAQVVDAVRTVAWTADGQGRRTLTPEGLYGRRKMTAQLRRSHLPEVSFGAVDRAMRLLGLSGVRRDKGIRTTVPAKDGKRAGDLVKRHFTADGPNLLWVADFERHEAFANPAVVKGHR